MKVKFLVFAILIHAPTSVAMRMPILSSFVEPVPDQKQAVVDQHHTNLRERSLVGSGAVKTLVWNDRNGNGIQDSGEEGVSGVKVEVINDVDLVLGTGATIANGLAEIGGLPTLQNLRLRYTSLPSGASFADNQNAGNDGNRDSDVNPSTGISNTFQFTNNEGSQVIEYVDAGVYKPGTVKTLVWNDRNGNGIQDSGEEGVSGVTVEVIDYGGSVLGTGATIANGLAEIGGLPTLQKLRLRYTSLPSGASFAVHQNAGNDGNRDSDVDPLTGISNTFQLTKGSQVIEYVDAGIYQPGTVKTLVWNDKNGNGIQDSGEEGVSGVTVEVIDDGDSVLGTGATIANGLAEIGGLPTLQNLRLRYTSLPSGASFAVNQNAGNDGNRDSDVNPLTGISNTFQLTKGSQVIEYVDAGVYQPGMVKTLVWNDRNGNGIQDSGEEGVSGVAVELLLCSVSSTKTTSAAGFVEFVNVPTNSAVTLRYKKPLFSRFTEKDVGSDNERDSDPDPFTATTDLLQLIKGSQRIEHVDAGILLPGTVKARVWNDRNGNGIQDSGEEGVEGVSVQVVDTNDSVIFGAGSTIDGVATISGVPADRKFKLKFSGLAGGFNFATFVNAGTDDGRDSDVDPQSGVTVQEYQLTQGSQLIEHIDAGVYKPGTVKTLVWNDKNGNGIQDSGEEGVSGVTVEVIDDVDLVVGTGATIANGLAEIGGLPTLQNLRLRYTSLPSGASFAVNKNAGNDGNRDSDVNPLTGISNTFQLTKGSQVIEYVDAGVYQPGTVKTRVWNDRNGNGIQDSGEEGVSGVTVEVIDDGDSVVGTGATIANGLAEIGGLPTLQNLRLRYTSLPSGTSLAVNKNAGNDDNRDSDVDPLTGISDTFQFTKGSQLIEHIDAALVFQ